MERRHGSRHGGPGRSGFPLTRRPENFDAERQERIGDFPSTYRDEGTRHFLREADATMGMVLREQPRPLRHR